MISMSHFIKLLKMNYDGFVASTKKLLKNISYATNDLKEHVARLQDDLAKYKTLTDMDVEFYKLEFFVLFALQ